MRRKVENLRLRYRRGLLLIAAILAGSLFAVLFAASSGANLASSPFEGKDGNMAVDAQGKTDWANVAGVRTLTDAPSGATDDSFAQGTSEDDSGVTIADGSIPPTKDDLTRAYVASESISGETFLYLAWERTINNGDANIDFELNQSPTPNWTSATTGPVTINRTAGDILITYDFGGSGAPDLGLLTWLTSGSAKDCESNSKLPCWGDRIDLSANQNVPEGEGAVNSSTIAESLAGGSLGVGLFGEAKIDLSAIPGFFGANNNSCRSFGSMFVKSRSSGSGFNAEIKDFIAPQPVRVSNCATLNVVKNAVGGNGTFSFTGSGSIGNFSLATQSGTKSTTFTGVEPGSYTLAENAPPAGWDFSSAACKDDLSGSTVGSGGSTQSFTLQPDESVTCTYTNTVQGSIELKKHWVGTAGNATLNIGTAAGGSQTGTATANGADGTTGAKTVSAGTYYVSETVADASDYTSTLSCTDNGQTVTPGANNGVPVADNHTVVCTFTNTRNQGTIELKKHWAGTASSATLTIGTSAAGNQVATTTLSTDGTTGAQTVDTGTYYVSETVTDPGDYTSTLACTDNGQTVTPGANSSLSVTNGHAVVCTYTNTRNQGTIELKKHWVGTPGDATIDVGTTASGTDVASAAANGEDATTGTTAVDTGTYFVSESVTNPGDYTSTLACTDNGQTVTPGANSSLSVTSGHAVVCTYTNMRNQGTIELKKHWVGTAGTAVLDLGSSAGAHDVGQKTASGKDDTTGAKTVDTGTYFVAEDVTNPGDYQSSLACTDNGRTVTPGADNSLPVGKGDAVVCTFTNTRVQGSVELKKHWVGTAGTATLDIGTAAHGTQIASKSVTGDGTTGEKGVDTGTYFVSETFGAGTNASDYSAVLACFDDANDNGSQDNGEETVTPSETGGFAVGAGDHVVCTFTNRELPKVKLVKSLVPSNDDGTFDFAIGDRTFDNAGDGYGDQGTTGFVHVQPGAPVISEAGHGDTDLSGYSTTISCTNEDSANGTSLDLSRLTYGDAVTCTFTNSRLPLITIQKRIVPVNDSGAFDFAITQGESRGTFDNDGSGYGNLGSTGPIVVDTGSATIDEAGHGSTKTSDYTSTWSCSNEQSGSGTSIDLSGLSFGERVTCTFTNTRLATLIVRKVVDNSNGGGSKSSADFTLHVSTAGLEIGKAAGSSSGTPYSGLLPGTYLVTEDSVAGYSLTSATCDNGANPSSGVQLGAGQTVTCTLTNTSAAPPPPPPPPPPAPKIDLSITKTGSPNPTTVNKDITWTMVVTNNGPNNATGVTVADPIPAGTTYVSSATSQGTCTGGAVLSCSLGNLGVGSSVTITLVTTANQTGTIPNTATVVGNEAETNTANNTASASVNVVGVFKPPAVVYCTAVAVTPKQLFVGRTNTLRMRLTQHGKVAKGIRVRIKGSTISVTTGPSNAHGSVIRTVKPMKAGIVTFTPVASKRCNAPRVGVIGVFTPPVTG